MKYCAEYEEVLRLMCGIWGQGSFMREINYTKLLTSPPTSSDILLLDEPDASLDEASMETLSILVAAASRTKLVIAATHSGLFDFMPHVVVEM